MKDTPHVFVISHRRSGTHLTIDTIAGNFAEWNRPYLNIDRLHATHESPLTLTEVVRELDKGPHIIKSHAHHDIPSFFLGEEAQTAFVEGLLDRSRILYVHRDGRDVMVSLYYYMQVYRSELRSVPFSDFLRTLNDEDDNTYEGELSRPAYWARHVSGWIDDERITRIPFELLRGDYEGGAKKLASALGRDIPPKIVSAIRVEPVDVRRRSGVWKDRLQRLSLRLGRGVRSTAVSFRKGQTGDHEAHFSEEDLAFFEREAGETMARLGYALK